MSSARPSTCLGVLWFCVCNVCSIDVSQRQDEGFSQLLSKQLSAQGFEVAASTKIDGIAEGETVEEVDPNALEQFQIKLMMCPKLRALFTTHHLRVVAEAVRAPMVEVVRNLRPWMMDGEGEGVVLTIGSHSGDRGGLVKWKTATESQGSAPDVSGRSLQMFLLALCVFL